MVTSLPWSVKGVDPRTRDAAKAAARRAGMTLGEWLDHKIREEAEEDSRKRPKGAGRKGRSALRCRPFSYWGVPPAASVRISRTQSTSDWW